MRTIVLAPAAAVSLAPLAFGEFQPQSIADMVIALWCKTLPECHCVITVAPDNFAVFPWEPKEFHPVGPWSYNGRFEEASRTERRDAARWTGESHEGFTTPHAAFAEGFDEHRGLCHAWRQANTLCVYCQVRQHDHHTRPGGSVFACDTYAPTEAPHGERAREVRRAG